MVFTDGIHLIAEDVAELHNFAKSIGLKPCWYHGSSRHPHYDLYSGKIAKNRTDMQRRAMVFGAILVPTRTLIKISRRCYFLPETDEEVEEFERRNKWELSQPMSEKDKEMLDKMGKEIINKLYKK